MMFTTWSASQWRRPAWPCFAGEASVVCDGVGPNVTQRADDRGVVLGWGQSYVVAAPGSHPMRRVTDNVDGLGSTEGAGAQADDDIEVSWSGVGLPQHVHRCPGPRSGPRRSRNVSTAWSE